MSGRGNAQRGGDRGRSRGRGQGPPQGSGIRGGAAGRGRGGDSPGGGRGRGDTGSEGRGGRGSGFRGGRGGGSDFGGGGRARGSDFRGGPRGGGRGGPPGSVIFQPGPVPPVDARLASNDLDQLVSSFKRLEVKTELPLRPGYGTLGRPITLRANFFPVRVPKGPIYDYNVEISPKTDINRIKARLFVLLEQSPVCAPFKSHIAHDGSQRLVSAKQLPQPLDVQIPFYEDGEAGPRPDGKTYVASITYVRDLDTSELTKYLEGQTQFRDYDPLPLISALNLVLQQHPAHSGVRFGRNRYFFPPGQGEKINLGLGLEAWKGFFTSVRPAYKQLMVNVNVCFTAFYEPGNLADAIMAFNRRSKGGMPKKFSQGIKVTTSHLGYKMRRKIKSIAANPANKTSFDCAELGGRVTVEQYFNRKYSMKLKHAGDLPVVDISGRNSKQPNYVPAELCQIEPGQPYAGKLDPQETATMIRYACNIPSVNAQAIVHQGLPTLGLTSDENQSETVGGFDLSISTEMAVIPARELPAPRLSYRVGIANVRDGSWNILDVKFHRGGTVSSWWVLIVRDGPTAPINTPNDPQLVSLIKDFAAKCERSGMKVAGPPTIIAAKLLPPSEDPIRSGSVDAIRQAIKKQLAASSNKKPSFILVMLANVDNFIYPGIKRIGDVELGIPTVCMQHSKAFKDARKQDQYFSNVALKVNTKLNGINHKLDADSMKWLTSRTTMIVGMDVTHPGPTSIQGTPSIAAVVASVDDTFVQFPASIRVQEGKKEMITDMKEMMTERLLVYQKHNKRLPERIYIYRDGVSEGQFETVLHEELPLVIESFKRFNTKTHSPSGAPYRPKVTIIICGKRHHARFYPTDPAHADKNGNTKPGTVVDKGITEVYGFDFYLQAHAGLQGTVRPTHYTVVYDENLLGADEVQQGTHHASYLYARATKAVSLVPAAYYADLACERGRCYINDFLVADDKTSTAGASVGGRVKGRGKIDREEEKDRVFAAAKEMWGEGLHDDLKETMFYI